MPAMPIDAHRRCSRQPSTYNAGASSSRTRGSRTPRTCLACDLRDACHRLRANAAVSAGLDTRFRGYDTHRSAKSDAVMSKKAFSPAEIEQLANLAKLPHEAIDAADRPEAPVQNRVHARRSELHRALNRPSRSAWVPTCWRGSKNAQAGDQPRAAARGRSGAPSRLGLWAIKGPREAVILAEIAAARARSAARPRLGEFDADRVFASPHHVDFAEIARSVYLQREGVGHLDIFFHGPHLGALVGNVEDLAIEHGQNAAGIRPGANVLDLAIFAAAFAVAGKILDFFVQARLLNSGSFLERGSERSIVDDRLFEENSQR